MGTIEKAVVGRSLIYKRTYAKNLSVVVLGNLLGPFLYYPVVCFPIALVNTFSVL